MEKAEMTTKQGFIDAFLKAEDVQTRQDIFIAAACSGLWPKCQGTMVDGEAACVAGLICILAGVPIVDKHLSGSQYLRFNGKFKSENDTVNYVAAVGFNPWYSKTVYDSDSRSHLGMVGLNDGTSMPLCKIAEVGVSVSRGGDVLTSNGEDIRQGRI